MNKEGIFPAIVILTVLPLTPMISLASSNTYQGNTQQPEEPPAWAIELCAGMQVGDSVEWPGRYSDTITALCQEENGLLVAVPALKKLSSGHGRYKHLFSLVDTGQDACYDNTGETITCPSTGESFYGQDAQFTDKEFDYTDNGDGTITDNITGLVWQQVPSSISYSWEDAQTYCEDLSLAEEDDWRTPNLKELFSISDFTTGWPYINTDYFGLTDSPDLKQQYWSSNYYEIGTTHEDMPSAMGVNHGTGHIKAYPDGSDGAPIATKYVRCVQGREYGINTFVDRRDGTVIDRATGLMWMQDDSLTALDWQDALAFAEQKNGENYLGYNDWRVPNIKELQSIVDYSGVYPAIDSRYFQITDENSYFWSSTSAYVSPENPGYYYAWYVAFGYTVDAEGEDLHEAGAVRFDIKAENGPAGEDPERIYNYVRLVRDADARDN
jgi:hypothetical protein